MYDYSKLRGKITEKFSTQSNFAKALGISEHSLSTKVSGKTPFKQAEISAACALLDIPSAEVMDYFFKLKVQIK